MFGFFKKRSVELPASPRLASPPPAPLAAPELSRSISSHDVRAELVQTVLKDTVRAHGLPADWLRVEVDSLSGVKGNGPLHIRIIMTQWNGTLLKYTMALERVILSALDRYDPAVDHSGYTVSWQFAKECVCPFPTLPAPQSWVKKKTPLVPKIAATSDFFERRQRARPAPPLNPDHSSDAYADTTLSPP